jgi:cytochrome c oxidase subunit 3
MIENRNISKQTILFIGVTKIFNKKMNKNILSLQRKEFQSFPFHLVTPSPWPILISFSLLNLTIGAVMSMHGYANANSVISLGLILTVSGMLFWFRDIIIEGTMLGDHTKEVVIGLVYGIVLFIISEVFAFLSVFWAFLHSSLSPAIEIGGIWPPLGVSPLNPYAIPLLNTFLLLSSGATITYGHHALIGGKRYASIEGTLITIILAIIFTLLQVYEYNQAPFTLSDGIFGSGFFVSTGLHGLTIIVPTKFINNKDKNIQFLNKIDYRKLSSTNIELKKDKLLIQSIPILKNKYKFKNINLDLEFLEWLSGFTDAEGNFNISLRNLNNNKYNSVILTFQIGLHIDDLKLLQLIKEKLNCGHISISGNKCNYFVNDQISLIHIILPIFNYVKLQSSKYYQFLNFEKAVNLIKNKKHLIPEGKLEMIKYYNEMKTPFLSPSSQKLHIPLTINWIGGFTDGDGSFSISNNKPRLKYENSIKELELFKKIKEYFNLSSNNLNIVKSCKNRPNSSPMVIFEITQIHMLKNFIVPIFYKKNILLSKKLKDFNDWAIIVNIYYHGYHLLPEGLAIINEIKNRWNNFRLSTSSSSLTSNLKTQSNVSNQIKVNLDVIFENKLKYLYSLPSPYEIKKGVRFIRGTNNLVSDKLKIISIDNFNNKSIFSSITECSKSLKIDRSRIKKCLLSGETYNNYKFSFFEDINLNNI